MTFKKKCSLESTDDPWCDSTKPRLITFDEIQQAQKTITPAMGVTPCIRSRLSEVTDMEVYLKLESFQKSGNFKERGARNAMLSLTDEEKRRGVVAASSGNHAQGVSINGRDLGIPVTVVMPISAALVKVEKCKEYGANIILHGNTIAEAKKFAIDLAKKEGRYYINGYDHPLVIAGQGVIGMEIFEQMATRVDAVICPIGGGGLLAGVSVAIKALSPSTEVIGVEAETCAGFLEALKHGKPTATKFEPSVADGLLVPKVGYNAFRTAKDKLDRLITVSEDLLDVAVLHLVEYEKIVSEGSGAAPLAAIYSGKLNHLRGKRVCLVVSGGNIDTSMLSRAMQRGLAVLGRYIKFSIFLTDRTGALADLTKFISELGVNIKEMDYERSFIKNDNYNAKVTVYCEVKDINAALLFKSAVERQYKHTDFSEFPCINIAKQITEFKNKKRPSVGKRTKLVRPNNGCIAKQSLLSAVMKKSVEQPKGISKKTSNSTSPLTKVSVIPKKRCKC